MDINTAVDVMSLLNFGYPIVWCLFLEAGLPFLSRILAICAFLIIICLSTIYSRVPRPLYGDPEVPIQLGQKENCQSLKLQQRSGPPLDLYQYIYAQKSIQNSPMVFPTLQFSPLSHSSRTSPTSRLSLGVSKYDQTKAYLALKTGRKKKFYFGPNIQHCPVLPFKSKPGTVTPIAVQLGNENKRFGFNQNEFRNNSVKANKFSNDRDSFSRSVFNVSKKRLRTYDRRATLRRSYNHQLPFHHFGQALALPSILEEHEIPNQSSGVMRTAYIPPNLILEDTLTYSLSNSEKTTLILDSCDSEDFNYNYVKKRPVSTRQNRKSSLKRRSFLSVSEKFYDQLNHERGKKRFYPSKITFSLVAEPWRNIYSKIKIRFGKQKEKEQ
jgi:hypothetical protein